MEGIKDKVAIVGMGCTQFGERWDSSFGDLAVEAAYEAFEDAGIGPKDIQAAWLGTTDFATGESLSVPMRLQYIPVTRVENRCCTGIDTFRNACYSVVAGMYDVVLAIGVEKMKDSGYQGAWTASVERHPVYHAATRGGPPSRFAVRATSYFNQYCIDPQVGKEMLAKIAVKNHHNGNLCPKAQYHNKVTLEQVMAAPIICWPLGILDACGVADGAAAAIITRSDMAKNFRQDPVFVKAITVCCDPGDDYNKNTANMTHFEVVNRASRMAYEEAGIKNPFKEISLAEVHDCFTITEALLYESLGFCPKGQAKDYIDSGVFTLGGELPVNADGGLKCFGHPLGASGLRMIYEIYKQLQGKADLPSRQLKKPVNGLAQNLAIALDGWLTSIAIVGL